MLGPTTKSQAMSVKKLKWCPLLGHAQADKLILGWIMGTALKITI
jgi:hypothetical protein